MSRTSQPLLWCMRFSALVKHHALPASNTSSVTSISDMPTLGYHRPYGGAGIVEGGEAVHEYGGIPLAFHGGGVHLVGGKQAYSLCPYSIRLAHGYPYVGVDNVGVGGALLYVLGEGDGAAVFRRDGTAGIHQLLGGEQRLWRAGGEVRPILAQANTRELPMLLRASPM